MASTRSAQRSVPVDRSGEERPPPAPARPIINGVRPQVDCGRRPAKAAVGDLLAVEANAFADGHDELWCELRYRSESASKWTTVPMEDIGNDRWRALMPITELGPYRFAVRARIDRFATWRRDLRARAGAGQELGVELQAGAELLEEAAQRAKGTGQRLLTSVATELRSGKRGLESDVPEQAAALGWNGASALGDVVFSDDLLRQMGELGSAEQWAVSDTFRLVSEPAKARCSTWYELFPRSAARRCADATARSPTSRARLDYVEQHGLRRAVPAADPPHRARPAARAATGPRCRPGASPGSPWAIGGAPRAATARSIPSSAPSTDFRRPGGGSRGPRHRRGHRPGLPGLARPPVGQRAPRMVPPPARRHHPLRREPAQALRGHLPARLRDRPTGRRLWQRAARRRPVLDRAGRHGLPGRQPAHQAVRLLGVAHRVGQGRRIPRSSSWPRPSPGPA